MAKRNSVLDGFKEATSIPPKQRASWAYRVLLEFLDDKRAVIYSEFEDDKRAIAKQAALTKELRAENSPFSGRINIERRGNKIYLEKK